MDRRTAHRPGGTGDPDGSNIMNNQQQNPMISVNCANVTVYEPGATFGAALMLTSISEQELPDAELLSLGEKRLDAYIAKLPAGTRCGSVKVSLVSTKNDAYNYPSNDDYNDY
jgi:hypothetical protein